MVKKQTDKGVALVTVLLMLVVGMIIMATALSLHMHNYSLSLSDRKLTTAVAFASNAVTDLMRQLSDDPYKDHYSSQAIEIPPAFYAGGFSEIEIIPDSSRHTLFLQARGHYGQDSQNPEFSRRFTALIKFISDLTTYGTYLNENFTTSASDVTYEGKMWINGNWSITGSNVECVGGPVFVKDDISGNITIDGDLYYGGSKGGGVNVTGNAYNYFPLGEYPTISTVFYEAHYNYKYTAADHWYTGYPYTSYVDLEFMDDGTIIVNGGQQTITVPSSGLIIYGENCNIRVSGTVSGCVTVVADRIKVRGGLGYANGTSYASYEDSFAALATERMYWMTTTGSPMNISGAYFLDSTSQNIVADGDGGALNLYGTRNRGISVWNFSSSELNFDPNLDSYPPPGLPEKPKLVNFNLK